MHEARREFCQIIYKAAYIFDQTGEGSGSGRPHCEKWRSGAGHCWNIRFYYEAKTGYSNLCAKTGHR